MLLHRRAPERSRGRGRGSSSSSSGADLWTPADIAGCVLWLRADMGVINGSGSSGAGVAEWRDQSGAGNHATQTTPARQPIATVNGPGGLPALVFTSGMWLACNSLAAMFNGASGSRPWHMIASFKKTATTLNTLLSIANSAASNFPRINWDVASTSTACRVSRNNEGSGITAYLYTTTTSDNTWRAHQTWYNGTQGFYRNNATELAAQNYVAQTPLSLSWATIGANRSGLSVNGDSYWLGTLWELIVYSRDLNETERGEIYNYQKALGAAA